MTTAAIQALILKLSALLAILIASQATTTPMVASSTPNSQFVHWSTSIATSTPAATTTEKQSNCPVGEEYFQTDSDISQGRAGYCATPREG